jgi:hypothetical protein
MIEDLFLDEQQVKESAAPKYGVQPDGSYRTHLGFVFTAEEERAYKRAVKAAQEFMRKFGQNLGRTETHAEQLAREMRKMQRQFDAQCRDYGEGIESEDAMELLGCTVTQLRNWAREGKISVVKVARKKGQRIHYSTIDVLAIKYKREYNFIPQQKIQQEND